jgi:hypothetical protein
MNPSLPVLLSLSLIAASLPSLAESSVSSTASSASSASVGSLSTSVEGSSKASSRGDKVAEGAYRVITVADAPGRPGTVRVTLQALGDSGDSADSGSLHLYLPQQTAQNQQLAAGSLVHARARDYGFEFVQGEPRQAFFLAVRDEWLRDLQTRPVSL